MIYSQTATLLAHDDPSAWASRIILQDREGSRWLHFSNPRTIVTTKKIGEVPEQLAAIERMVNEQGLFAAGFISYEASPAFDSALVVRKPSDIPLVWFGLYDCPIEIPAPTASGTYNLGGWKPSVTKAQYDQAFYQIKDLIAAGRTYQVNHTLRLRARFSGSAWALFQDLVHAQESDYAAYLDLGSVVICSASPELFFELEGTRLTARPMKGTAPRGRTLIEDNQLADWLYHSEKNRAENVMIVDMIRNDIGRVSDIGSVSVPRLFDIERYPTLLQMTSTVVGRSAASIADIMAALFPCASITGAPKVSTMQNIAALESDPRGIYTGCIGYIAPGRRAQFNVAIRTVMIDRRRATAEYGVGGGIVWGSEVEGEYEECQTKARILTERRPKFKLLESILWTPEDGYYLLDEHLIRLGDSAEFFGYFIDQGQVRRKLNRYSHSLANEPQKVRLLLSRDGALHLEAQTVAGSSLAEVGLPAKVALATMPVDESDVFLYHKTTQRIVYDRARERQPGYDEILLWNRQGEITETTTANVVFRMQDEFVTPPITSGLLGGTFRADLLAKKVVREGVVTIEDLELVEEIHLINSVRKWRKAWLVSQAVPILES
ncbi:MAG TPA: aminodeoxychorismate synthase component I [Patescibacteria group bacterium]|nr:aminodeoxychorismate synthase component I [Patescibacteria group bacterium]